MKLVAAFAAGVVAGIVVTVDVIGYVERLRLDLMSFTDTLDDEPDADWDVEAFKAWWEDKAS